MFESQYERVSSETLLDEKKVNKRVILNKVPAIQIKIRI